MTRYLVVANQTLGGEHLLAEMRRRSDADPGASFHLLVPATPPDLFTFRTEGGALAVAEQRLQRAMRLLDTLGVELTGEVGDQEPLGAISDALREADYDAIILSTLPVGVSRWLGMDLPSRVERSVSVPVTHVVGDAVEEPGS